MVVLDQWLGVAGIWASKGWWARLSFYLCVYVYE